MMWLQFYHDRAGLVPSLDVYGRLAVSRHDDVATVMRVARDNARKEGYSSFQLQEGAPDGPSRAVSPVQTVLLLD